MIIEVQLGDEAEPRRYELQRADDTFRARRLVAGEERAGAGDRRGTHDTSGGHDTHGGDEARRADDDPGTILIDWRRPEPRIYSLIVDRNSYEVFVDDNEDHLEVHLVNRTFRVLAADARVRRAVAGGSAKDGAARISAPIPGRVVKVLAAAGTKVARGDGIVVLEAMKMENELRAPRAGVVATVEVEEGQGVEGGTLLATIE